MICHKQSSRQAGAPIAAENLNGCDSAIGAPATTARNFHHYVNEKPYRRRASGLPGTKPNRFHAQRQSYYRKLWIRCRDEKGGVAFRVDHANPGGSRVEGDATDA